MTEKISAEAIRSIPYPRCSLLPKLVMPLLYEDQHLSRD